jgi:DNA-binding transcriptional ArsR family regulator
MGRSQDEGGPLTGTPVKPLEHRVRRCVLRCLYGSGPLTPAEISRELAREPSEVRYHLRMLTEHGMVREKRRRTREVEAGFESQIADKAEIIELLISTRAEDEADP